MVDKDRSSEIEIGGQNYTLVLTTRAVKEIAQRYGSLDLIGDKIANSKDVASTLSEIIWLVTLLANQEILIHNLKNPGDKKELLTEESIEILTKPQDFAKINIAITKAMNLGAKRNVLGENEEKLRNKENSINGENEEKLRNDKSLENEKDLANGENLETGREETKNAKSE
jgi:hypothetical protein